jgi:DDE superfamily endonuclease
LVIGALDETGQQKKGEATAGVKRQHLGCAGRVENGINTVHLSYVREGTGHALIGFRQWSPEEHIADPVRSLRMGLPVDLMFRTKGQLAIDLCTTVAADGIRPDFYCGDEVTATAPSCGPTSRPTSKPMCCGSRRTSGSRCPAAWCCPANRL